jgi:opine dehydrogenase
MRYIQEDVPASLVPIASIGKMLGIETPIINSIITIASAINGCDYWAEGRTVERLGIQNMNLRDLRLFAIGEASTGNAHNHDPARID